MSPHKILIVDDESAIVLALKRVFEKEGFKAVTAETGVAAINALSKNKVFSAALVDLMLPDMSGLQIIDAIKKQDPCTQIFAMSALSDEAAAKALELSTICGIISKPFEDIFEVPKIVLRALQSVKGPGESIRN